MALDVVVLRCVRTCWLLSFVYIVHLQTHCPPQTRSHSVSMTMLCQLFHPEDPRSLCDFTATGSISTMIRPLVLFSFTSSVSRLVLMSSSSGTPWESSIHLIFMLMCGITALSGFIPCADFVSRSCLMLSWYFLITLTRSADGRLQRARVFRVVLLVEADVFGFESSDKIGRREGVKSTHSQTIVRHPKLD